MHVKTDVFNDCLEKMHHEHAAERVLKAKAQVCTLGSANREKAPKNLEKVLPKITHDEYSEILEKENENYTGREPYENQGSLENRRLAGMEKALEKELPEAAKRGLAQMDLLERTKTKKSHSNTGN